MESIALPLPVCARISDYPNFPICKWQLLNHPFDYVLDNFGLWIRLWPLGGSNGERKKNRFVHRRDVAALRWHYMCVCVCVLVKLNLCWTNRLKRIWILILRSSRWFWLQRKKEEIPDISAWHCCRSRSHTMPSFGHIRIWWKFRACVCLCARCYQFTMSQNRIPNVFIVGLSRRCRPRHRSTVQIVWIGIIWQRRTHCGFYPSKHIHTRARDDRGREPHRNCERAWRDGRIRFRYITKCISH